MDALVQWFDENRCFFIGFGAGVVTTLLVLGAVVVRAQSVSLERVPRARLTLA